MLINLLQYICIDGGVVVAADFLRDRKGRMSSVGERGYF